MQDLKELNEVITAIKEEIRQGADALTTSKSVYEFKKTFLDNKQGRIGLLMKEMRNVANDQKAEFGKTINGAKEWANNFFDELDQKLKEKEQQQRYESEKIDITSRRRLTDDNAAAVVDQNTVSELCARMNLNQCKETCHL